MWFLYLRQTCEKAYEMLPCTWLYLTSFPMHPEGLHSLCELYRCFLPAVDHHLMEIEDVSRLQWSHLLKRIYIMKDLMFSKVSGDFVGFSNLRDITCNSRLLQFQSSLKEEGSQEQLAFQDNAGVPIVQGGKGAILISGIPVPTVTIPTLGSYRMGRTIESKGACFDINGPFLNRHLFNGKGAFFVSDLSHPMKTVRNCLASKSHKLWVS